MEDFDKLYGYCTTERQREILTAYKENDFKNKKTARAMGVDESTTRHTIKQIKARMALAEGEEVSVEAKNYNITNVSTLYDSDGNIKSQWVKSNTSKEAQIDILKSAITEMAEELEGKCEPTDAPVYDTDDMMTMYISNDIHFGELMWGEETMDGDWDLKIAEKTISSSYQYLVNSTPKSRDCVVVDLGDLNTIDDFKNMTPKSGNIISVDGRYPKILKAAYMSIINGITLALQKHERVYFINISGNHDITGGHVVREVVSAWFRNEPRVIINESPSNIKYHAFGKCLFQFAHGDGMKMQAAGECMAVDMKHIFSDTEHRYSHFGHNHKDQVYDGRVTKCESHRNLAYLNDWASHAGYRRGLGTMKAITYHKNHGEIARNTFNVSMVD